MSYNGRLGLYGFLYSWEEQVGENAANAFFNAATWGLATYVGFQASRTLNNQHFNLFPSKNKKKDEGTFSQLVHGVKDLITLPYRFITGKGSNIKHSLHFLGTWLGPQVVVKDVMQPAIESWTDGAVKTRAVAFLRPFMEKIMPVIYEPFDRGDLDFSLRRYIPNESKNPGPFAQIFDTLIAVPGQIISAPIKAGYGVYKNLYDSQAWSQQRIGENYYNYGQKVIDVCEGNLGLFFNSALNTAYQLVSAPVDSAKCISQEGFAPCADKGLEWTKQKVNTMWRYSQPMREGLVEAAHWGFNKSCEGARFAATELSEQTGGRVGPDAILWGGTIAAGLAGGLLTWRHGRDVWNWFWAPRRPKPQQKKGQDLHVHNHQPPPILVRGRPAPELPKDAAKDGADLRSSADGSLDADESAVNDPASSPTSSPSRSRSPSTSPLSASE